jgi:protein involved in polysaccharide export with SLBB domain
MFLNAYSQGGGVTSEARALTEKQLALSVRVVVNMEKIVSGGSDNPDNIILMNGDSISVPDKQETVSVIGAVMGPVTTKPGSQRTVSDLVSLAGGYAKDADQDGVLVFRVNGTLIKAANAGKVEDGDVIYVPTKVMTTEVITTEDKVIGAIKFTLITIASVVVFLALIP